MTVQELQHGKFYRMNLMPTLRGVCIANGRVRCIRVRDEVHLVLEDSRFEHPMQWRVEDGGGLSKFDYSGQWVSDGSNIRDCLTEDTKV